MNIVKWKFKKLYNKLIKNYNEIPPQEVKMR